MRNGKKTIIKFRKQRKRKMKSVKKRKNKIKGSVGVSNILKFGRKRKRISLLKNNKEEEK